MNRIPNLPPATIRRVGGPATGNAAARSSGEVHPSPPGRVFDPPTSPPPLGRLNAISEEELFTAYDFPAVPLTEPCVCGSVVYASSRDIPGGVAAHNQTRSHRLWRIRNGIEP